MKALFSEDYYRKNWDKFLVKVPGDDYRNLEAELERVMAQYNESSWVTDNVRAVIEKVEAKKIADSCTVLVYKEMALIKRLENETSSLGYTTKRQEIEARTEFRKRFEFNCLQLRDFKAKYGLS